MPHLSPLYHSSKQVTYVYGRTALCRLVRIASKCSVDPVMSTAAFPDAAAAKTTFRPSGVSM